MRAGTLRHRVDIQALTVTIDADTGAQSEGWANFLASEPASIVAMSGREFTASAAVQGVNLTKITIRQHEGVIPSMRVVHGSDLYNIQAVLPDPTLRRHLVLMCEIGENDG
jgi:head-tail adaptor